MEIGDLVCFKDKIWKLYRGNAQKEIGMVLGFDLYLENKNPNLPNLISIYWFDRKKIFNSKLDYIEKI